MRHTRLIYSNFVANRPEPTSLLEVWCLIGGVILVIFVASDSGTGFVGKPQLETILSLVFPAIYFYTDYISRHFHMMEKVLILSICASMFFSGYLFFNPLIPRHPLPNSDLALFIFSLVSLVIIATKSFRQ